MGIDILDSLGIKVTKQRRAILNVILQAEVPLSADEIYARLAQDGTNFSTVYRTLATLAEKGALIKVGEAGAKTLFQLKDHTHKHHLICTECRKVLEIDECPIEALSHEIADSTGFKITGHCLELTGVCPSCARHLLKDVKPK
ncbi:Fur family transcriptional regulator [Acetanaerobacterium elongatum]|uniref:Fur family transcriptional regulator, ferric uptake regulator n=1 Tax=Acetanaerobacterium elongatum TaxID=258515 RepID=A0A1G9ZK05_9FIRM|nr:Fur family transcriptional regulator [Acetanaerobacterium elongatum]SDN21341.1 Fur family transcriptional regulator, ferric uptake regulator [Acetanaerobacterium elongatum]